MRKPNVLVVDDEAGIQALLYTVFDEADCRPLMAGTPSQALRLAADAAPDVAVLDYMLPEMDGIELAHRLRERLGDRFPLVLLSAMAIPENRHAELPGLVFVSKPFDIDDVVEAVHAALHARAPRGVKPPVLADASDGARVVKRVAK
jgi:DNA-binding response OmpR family regulator